MSKQATLSSLTLTGRRKRVTDLCVGGLLLASVIAVVGLAAALIHSPILPSLPRETAVAEEQLRTDASEKRLGLHLTSQLPLFAASSLSQTALRFAFVATDDSRSIGSLKQNASQLDAIIPDWLGTVSPNGEIALRDPASTIEVREWLRRNAPHLAIYPLLTGAVCRPAFHGVLGVA